MKPTSKENHGRQLSLAVALILVLAAFPVSAQEPKLRATLKPSGFSTLLDGVLAVNKDGTLLAGAGVVQGKWIVKLWDAATGKEQAALLHPSFVTSVAFSPDGKTVATACEHHPDRTPGGLRVWDLATGAEKTSLKAHKDFAIISQFSGDGSLLASCGGLDPRDREIKVWQVATWRVETLLKGELVNGIAQGAPSKSFALSRDGKFLAYEFNKTVKIRDLAKQEDKTITKDEDKTTTKHEGWLLQFSADGKLLATCIFGRDVGPDAVTKLWDVATGQHKTTLRTGKATSVAFKGNDVLASATGDKKVKLWDAVTGKEKTPLKHTHEVRSLAFSGDGQVLVAMGNGAITVWEMPVTKTSDK